MSCKLIIFLLLDGFNVIKSIDFIDSLKTTDSILEDASLDTVSTNLLHGIKK